MKPIQRRTMVELLHVLVVASLLLNLIPAVAQATPPQTGPAPSQVHREIEGSPTAWEEPREAALQAGATYSHTLFLPLVARNYAVGSQVEVTLEQWIEPWLALPGDVVTCTLVVENTGGLPVEGGVLVDRLPEQVEMLDAEGAEYDAKARELRWSIARLEAGQALTLVFRARVARGAEMSEAQSSAVFTAAPAERVMAAATLLVGETTVATLTPEGGELTWPGGRVRLVAPAGTVTETTAISLTTYPGLGLEPGGSGDVVYLEVGQDVSFASPATLDVNLDGLVDLSRLQTGQRVYLAYAVNPASIVVD